MPPVRARVMQEGLIAGFIGYLTVVLFIGLVNLFTGRSFFFTASLLGQSLIGGFGEPTPGVIVPGAVFALNGLHLLAFLTVGAAVAFVVVEVELHPTFWYVAFFALLGLIFLSFFALAALAEPLAEDLPRTPLILANALAALAMGGYLHRAHPKLWSEIERHGDPEL